jgi:para-aminobenzoate synthetase / 4-amino-4-deoxychorismate lyase
LLSFVDFEAVPWAGAAQANAADETANACLSHGSPALRHAFGKPQQVLVAHHISDVRGVIQAVHQHALAGRWCVGSVRYEAAPAWDRAFATHATDQALAWFGVHNAPLSQFELPAVAIASLADQPARAVWQAGLTRASFNAAMARLHEAIAAGDLYQANLTTTIHGTLKSSAWDLFTAMRAAQPGGFAAYIDTGTEQVLSVSPELFFDWQQGHLIARPMKGTAARGSTPQLDAEQAQRLLNSPKECAENVMIVDLIRNDLSRVAQAFSVKVPMLCQLQALPSVWQMVSQVHARTREGATLDDVFAALFPCGSVTGAPKVQAMRMIKQLEPHERGVYCGAVGIVRPGGDATFNVPIRTVLVQGDALRYGVGSGVTFDAEPEAEWREWQHKSAFVARASQRFALLETMALRDGSIDHAAAHLQRLQGSAAHFGYPCSLSALEQALSEAAAKHPLGAWRLRLQLHETGCVQWQAYRLSADVQPVRLQLAQRPMLQAHSEFVRHKTTHRAHYDAHAPTDAAVFDTVLWNTQGEVTECTRGNIAMQLDGQWVTPAPSSGLLAGVGRGYWLQQGRCFEAVVRLEDLPRVKEIAFINSLRGWLSADWHTPLQPALLRISAEITDIQFAIE